MRAFQAAVRPASFLKQQLAGQVEPEARTELMINGKACARLYASECGDERWFRSFPESSPADKPAAPPRRGYGRFAKRKSRREILERHEPSREETFERHASDLFDSEPWDVLNFGSAIHELFEKSRHLSTSNF